VESLEGATHASHDNEQVAHDDFSHLVFSLGLALSTRPKAVVAPPPVLTTEERKVHLKMEYDKTNQEIMESMLERRNNAQGIVKKVDPDTGDVTWVKESVSRRNQDRRGGPAGDAGYRRGGGISPGFQRGGGISRTD
jgi:glucan-binding YG repeat protein